MGNFMVTQLMVTLPDEIYDRIQRLAEHAGMDTNRVLTMMLMSSLPPLPELDTRPVQILSDEEVLALADSMMDTIQSARMSELLQKQQASHLDASERDELNVLMAIYTAGQGRKLEGLVEAIRRGLRKRLDEE